MQSGIYFIEAKNGKVVDLNANKMENGTNITLWTNNKGMNQKFMVVKLGDFYRFLLSCNQTKAIDGGGPNNNVHIYDFDINNKNQMWDLKLKQGQKDMYTLVCQGNNKAMEVDKNQNKDGANIQVNNINNSDGQLFKFINVGKEKPSTNKQTTKQEALPIKQIVPNQTIQQASQILNAYAQNNPYAVFGPGNSGLTLAQKLISVNKSLKGV